MRKINSYRIFSKISKIKFKKCTLIDRTNEYDFVEENLKNLQDEMHPVSELC